MALVFAVTLFSIDEGRILKVFGSISANTGFAPMYRSGMEVAVQVKSGTITSSPACIPAKR